MGNWGEDLYEPPSVLEAGAPVTFTTYDGWKGHKNVAKSAKHNLSSLAHQKRRLKILSVGLVFSRVPHQVPCVLVNLESCVASHQALYGETLHLQSSIKKQGLHHQAHSSL